MPASDLLGVRDAWHLLRRAGFGAHLKEVQEFAGLSRAAAVDALLEVKASSVRGPSSGEGGRVQLDRLLSWWLRRMLLPRYRLQEKMALFWHDHFPSSYSVVGRPESLAEQNAVFRRYGLGSFRELLHQVTLNRAMLEFLDGSRSVVGEVNENHARELMELFTLGPVDEGGYANYTEWDVKQLARALTGFTYDDVKRPVVYLSPPRYDGGRKSLFPTKPFHRAGVLGLENADGTPFPPETNVLDALFAHRDRQGRPTLARFLVRKLWAWFGSPLAEDSLVDELSGAFAASDYQLSSLMRALLTHDAFYAEPARRSIAKTPVDFVVQALIGLGAKCSFKGMRQHLTAMGMELFDPPGVEGWEHGPAWLSTSRYLARMTVAQRIAGGRSRKEEGFLFRPAVPEGATPETLADGVLAQLGLEVSPATRQTLVDYVSGGEFGSEEWYERKLRGLYMLVLSLPEFQIH